MVVGKRQRSAQGLGRLVLLAVSAIVLALVFFPAFAQAECTSSSCIEYSESIPEPGGGGSNHHKQDQANISKRDQGDDSNQTDPGKHGSKEAESEGESSQQGGAVAGGNEGGPSQGKGAGSHQGGSAKAKQPQGQSASNAPDSSGGSSPLVPILIAIAVLAAISVAAVMHRQRRQRGPGASTSPEAG